MVGADLVHELAGLAAADAVEKIRLGELALGEEESYVASAVKGFLATQGPSIAAELSKIVGPAAEKAAQAVKPTLQELAKEYAPTAFALVGGLIALSVLLGVYVAKKTYRRSA